MLMTISITVVDATFTQSRQLLVTVDAAVSVALHRKECIAHTNVYQSLYDSIEAKVELDIGVTWYTADGAVILVQKLL